MDRKTNLKRLAVMGVFGVAGSKPKALGMFGPEDKKMKRLLGLLIVCAMTSAASAVSVNILVNGSPWMGEDVLYGDWVSILLVDDRGPGFMTGSISAGSYINVSAGVAYSHTWYAPPMGGWSFTPAGGGYTSNGNALWIGAMLPADGIIFTHEFMIPYLEYSTIIVDYDILYSIQRMSGQAILLHVIGAGTLKADAGEGAVQAGWVRVVAGLNENVGGTGIDVNLATGNPAAIADRDRGGTGLLADVETDFYFADDENYSPGSDFILTLSNLVAGKEYTLRSYHNRSDEPTTIIPSVTVTGATNVSKPDFIVQDHDIMANPARIVFTAGAGDVVIRYQGPDGGCGGCQAFFNGFELALPIYVDASAAPGGDGSSWAMAYKYLQDALSVAAGSDELWVAAGVYTPDSNSAKPDGTGDREAMFELISGVTLYGGFPSGGGANWNERDPNAYETILSGDIGTPGDSSDNSYHVVTGSGTDPNAVLDGFTITAGNANGSGPDTAGGGMYNENGSPMVANCIFSGNCAQVGGGMENWKSSPTLTNCTFSSNFSTGKGGAIRNRTNSNGTFVNCMFIGNEADSDGGGMYNDNSSPTLINCTFSGNSAYSGGGMSNITSSPTVTNCTFSGNSADVDGGGIYNEVSSSLTVRNCIVWGNSDSGGTDESGQIHTADLGAIVDDMESYDPFNEIIWYYWDNPDWTGSYIGLGTAPFQPVHTGNQSMEYVYDNTNNFGYGFYSEGVLTFDSPQDWEPAGVKVLTLFFYGDPDNDANSSEQMYVGLADVDTHTYVDYDGDMSNIRIAEWQVWNIVLTEFTDVAMSDVRRIYLGFGDPDATAPGGDGVVYFDDIRVGSVAEIDYSCVQGWTGSLGGTGNIGDDPLFVDANGPDDIVGTEDDNLRLSPNSPCIGAGDNNSVPADITDLDGHPRIIDGDCNDTDVVDMGAYEFNYAYMGDFDYDCDVDSGDYAIFGLAWMTEEGQPGYNPACDISIPADSYIDWLDLDILTDNWLAGL